jgi:tRNA(Ile)-lysidine synthase
LPDLLKQVRRTIEEYGLLVPGDKVIVGVSGGPDSLCMLHVLMRLREVYSLQLHVAHLHHGARGAEADADTEFVAALATRWGLPVTVERQDVPALTRKHRLAFEETARRVRYAFLARVAEEISALKIAVGHNADDQAETVLMHFLRGSGPAGLRGMLPMAPLADYRLLDPLRPPHASVTRSSASDLQECTQASRTPASGEETRFFGKNLVSAVRIIRPLLEVPRCEIERYCADEKLTPRFDRSNLDITYFRNRLRHDLLPVLETYNPNIRARLCHTAAVVAADYALLAQMRDEAWARVIREEGKARVVFDRAAWRSLPVALQRAILRQAAYRLRTSLRDVDFVHVENARRVALRGETNAQATLPMGLALTVGYDTLTVSEAGDAGHPPDEPLLWTTEPVPVHVHGTTPLPQSEWELHAEIVGEWSAHQVTANPDPWTAYLDLDILAGPLTLRPRRRGDRFYPQGMQGHSVRLSAFMTNLKIPLAWRDHVPLLTAGDEIVWVCGHRVGDQVACGAETQRVARLWFTRAQR